LEVVALFVSLPIEQAGKHFPVPVGRGSLERWCRKGIRGAKLETVVVGSRRYVSKEGIDNIGVIEAAIIQTAQEAEHPSKPVVPCLTI